MLDTSIAHDLFGVEKLLVQRNAFGCSDARGAGVGQLRRQPERQQSQLNWQVRDHGDRGAKLGAVGEVKLLRKFLDRSLDGALAHLEMTRDFRNDPFAWPIAVCRRKAVGDAFCYREVERLGPQLPIGHLLTCKFERQLLRDSIPVRRLIA
jgi:hypothetical protein